MLATDMASFNKTFHGINYPWVKSAATSLVTRPQEAAGSNPISDGVYNSIAVNAPEMVGVPAGNLNYILKYLEKRGVIYEKD